MLNEIIKGISIKLNTTFGDAYTIHANDVDQGLEPKSFFINILKPELNPLLGRRYMKRNPFDVMYYPEQDGNHQELIQVAERLLDALEYVTTPSGDLLRGTRMNYEIQDDVLHFFVNYDHTLIKPAEETTMEILTQNVTTKDG